jgi:hypothetical protein
LTLPSKGKRVQALLRELSDDEDAVSDIGADVPNDPQRPWLQDYQGYIDTIDQVPEDLTTIQWWGVRISISF